MVCLDVFLYPSRSLPGVGEKGLASEKKGIPFSGKTHVWEELIGIFLLLQAFRASNFFVLCLLLLMLLLLLFLFLSYCCFQQTVFISAHDPCLLYFQLEGRGRKWRHGFNRNTELEDTQHP